MTDAERWKEGQRAVMARGGGVAAIDVGTTKVCTLVGGLDDRGRLRITGLGVVASHGMSKGVVDDVGRATAAIAAALREAERTGGARIHSATVGIGGAHIACLNSRGTLGLPSLQRPISEEDVRRALEGARTVPIANNREILHALPRFFVIDGEQSTGDPVGKYGHRLDVEAHLVTGAVAAIQNLTRCVEGAGVQVDALVLQPVAAADAVLDEEERAHGVVLADIGGGTTDIALFVEGAVLHTAVLPVGGNNVTNDLVYGLRAPFSAADWAKVTFGHALAELVPPDETFEMPAFGAERRRLVNRRRMCEIVQARVEEILELIRGEIRRVGYEEMIPAGVVLTGGTATLPGMVDLATRVLGMPARVGSPGGADHMDELLENPAFSTSIGLLNWAVREQGAVLRPARARRTSRAGGGAWRKVSSLLRIYLPEET
jgi:cell division protein FtsA